MPLEPSSNFTQASSWANDWETLFYFEVGIFIFNPVFCDQIPSSPRE